MKPMPSIPRIHRDPHLHFALLMPHIKPAQPTSLNLSSGPLSLGRPFSFRITVGFMSRVCGKHNNDDDNDRDGDHDHDHGHDGAGDEDNK